MKMMKRGSWFNLIADEVKKRAEAQMKTDALYDSLILDNHKQMLEFLYYKEVMADAPDVVRRPNFSFIIDPGSAGLYKARFVAAQNRLERLISTDGDFKSKTISKDTQSFGDFLNTFPDWKDETLSFICFRDDPMLSNTLIYRVQRASLCYLHAPNVLQYYLVAKGRKDANQPIEGTIDISSWISHSFPALSLEHHIFDDRGGSAPLILEQILAPDSIITSYAFSSIDKDHLLKYGPQLVTQFTVHRDFKDSPFCSFVGKPSGERCGKHAMLLVGVKGNGVNKRFLLQNWWVKKQFIEVDETYLKHCSATLSFVETPQLCAMNGFTRFNDLYGECEEGFDKEEEGEFLYF